VWNVYNCKFHLKMHDMLNLTNLCLNLTNLCLSSMKICGDAVHRQHPNNASDGVVLPLAVVKRCWRDHTSPWATFIDTIQAVVVISKFCEREKSLFKLLSNFQRTIRNNRWTYFRSAEVLQIIPTSKRSQKFRLKPPIYPT